MSDDLIAQITQSIVNGDPDEALALTQQAITAGIEKGMEKSMELLEPELEARQQSIERAGTIVIGTVQGDIHEIGKSLVGTMLRCFR